MTAPYRRYKGKENKTQEQIIQELTDKFTSKMAEVCVKFCNEVLKVRNEDETKDNKDFFGEKINEKRK